MATACSGSPLWCLQTEWLSRKPTFVLQDLCLWTDGLAKVVLDEIASPLLPLIPVMDEDISSPKAFDICSRWWEIVLFRFRKCLETVLTATEI